MSTPQSRWGINSSQVIAKVIDGESIIIDLSTGTYYSTDAVGAEIWQLLVAGNTAEEIATTLAERYGAEPSRVLADTERMLSELRDEHLVCESQDGANPQEITLEAVNGRGYQAPELNKHTDMGDVLALDPPLPQVEEEPWPEK